MIIPRFYDDLNQYLKPNKVLVIFGSRQVGKTTLLKQFLSQNAIIANFNSLELRDDIGKLWENFIVAERLKKQSYKKIYANNYFWRTWDRKEIDWVEEREGKLFGYEFKWKDKQVKAPRKWLENYPGSDFQVVNADNYLDFVT